MYTHKVMCSFMVTKLVKFCQTLFFFLNTMPVALLTSTPGFPAGSFTYNLLSWVQNAEAATQTQARLAGAAPVTGLTWADRQSFASYL